MNTKEERNACEIVFLKMTNNIVGFVLLTLTFGPLYSVLYRNIVVKGIGAQLCIGFYKNRGNIPIPSFFTMLASPKLAAKVFSRYQMNGLQNGLLDVVILLRE